MEPALARMTERAFAPGQESLLFAVVDDPGVPKNDRARALDCLGHADTPGTREELLARLTKARKAPEFLSLARPLARLRERRALPRCAERLTDPSWKDTEVRDLLELLPTFGPAARPVVLDYLRDPEADVLHFAVRALAELDPTAARDEAARLLDGPRAAALDALSRRNLERTAGRR